MYYHSLCSNHIRFAVFLFHLFVLDIYVMLMLCFLFVWLKLLQVLVDLLICYYVYVLLANMLCASYHVLYCLCVIVYDD